MRRSSDEDWSWGDTFVRFYTEYTIVGGILSFVASFALGIWLLFTDWAWLGVLLLAMILGAWAIVIALRRRNVRNPHRHARAKSRKATSSGC
jgi:Kef-type K+ transport system membrane component KefB